MVSRVWFQGTFVLLEVQFYIQSLPIPRYALSLLTKKCTGKNSKRFFCHKTLTLLDM